ncbi:unnamed protein product [Owenia fusiformis]|uniref:Uncharacterized protein n=1 Tax=Owenia fusiformis TaxID=6347 RepID=A0A8J1Y141_OWEFU|nr:unnamed protein product [Owenia fusiformis]
MDVVEDFHIKINSNETIGDGKEDAVAHFTDSSVFLWATMLTYGAFSLVGTLGNLVVIVVVAANKPLHTMSQFLITQLAIGDLITLLFCMPFSVTSAYLFKSWPFGEFMCYFVAFGGCIGPSVSILTLLVMSFERYLAVVYPLKAKSFWTKGKVCLACAFIYLVSFTRALIRPILVKNYSIVYSEDDTGKGKCSSTVGSIELIVFNAIGGVGFYCIPLLIIGFCYAKIHTEIRKSIKMAAGSDDIIKKRERATRVVFAIIILFGVMWLPIYIVTLMYVTDDIKVFGKENWFIVFVFVARILEYGNGVVNPIFYSLLSDKFRKCLRNPACCAPGVKEGLSETSASTSKTTSTTILDDKK